MTALWPGYLADPFVAKFEGFYYAYGTDGEGHRAIVETGREIPTLRSRDLKSWQWAGGVLNAHPNLRGLSFWAPEVAKVGGLYLLYFSVGDPEGQGQRIRVAISSDPLGPFIDSEIVLFPNEPFTIDAHPFCDPADGRRYLFFCRDYFDGRAGTGIAAVTLSSDGLLPTSEPTTILRASADWQIYERNRTWYGKSWSAWHTAEGPFVVFHEGRYWLFYSGGSWKSDRYGIGCAVAEDVLGPYAEEPGGPSVLAASADLIGPGHCSVFRGPKSRDILAFHAWNEERTMRQLHLLPLDWTERGPVAIPPNRHS